MKRAVLYIRTSKTTQCPENQLPQLEEFCKDKRAYHCTGVCRTGKRLGERTPARMEG